MRDNSRLLFLFFRYSYIKHIFWGVIFFVPLSLLFVIVFFVSDVQTNPKGWEKKIFVSSPLISAKKLCVSSKGNYIFSIYENIGKNKNTIYSSISFNGGNSFLRPVKIVAIKSEINNNPNGAISNNGKVFVVWQNIEEKELTNRIFFSQSTDFGATWVEPKQVFVGFEMEMLPHVFYDDRGLLHLFFQGFSKGAFAIYHSVANKDGVFKKFSILMKFRKGMRGAFFPDIKLVGNNFYAVWQGKGSNFKDNIYFMKSSNYGNSWSSPIQLTDSRFSEASPKLEISKNNVFVVFKSNENKSWGVKLLKGYNFGRNWENDSLSVSETNSNCYSPNILKKGRELLIVWRDSREGRSNLFSRKYNLYSKNFSPEIKLSDGRFSAKNPFLIKVGDKVVLFWEENYRIVAKFSDVSVKSPFVFSYTNPSNRWSRNPNAVIKWKPPRDESGIAGYSLIISKPGEYQIKEINPTIQNVKSGVTKMVLKNLDDGITYFHIRAIDGAGNYSRTVHYKIKVGANPLPSPIVVSPTHKILKSSDSKKPIFNWSVDAEDRLKGFVYSFSKDAPVNPNIFTKDFSKKFNSLSPGKYFFSIRAIDKTNLASKIETYPIIVGGGSFSKKDLLEIAKGKIKYKKNIRPHGIYKPYVSVIFPFDLKNQIPKKNFKALVKTFRISKKNVVGFSYYIGEEKQMPDNIIDKTDNILNFYNLKNGKYFLSLKVKYRERGKGQKYSWTPIYKTSFNVKVPVYYSPLEKFIFSLSRIIVKKEGFFYTILFFILLIFMLGFRKRMNFYFRYVNFKFKSVYRLFL